jgi:predicted lipoprotein with Yx(FWY)xxD motif
MRRSLTIATVVAACLALGAALAVASAKPALQLHHTKLGTLIVANNGFTVYAFDKDKTNKDACQSIKACLAAWPIVKPSTVLAGPGIKASLIGMLSLKNGKKQLTYAGHALYTYAGDSSQHETDNVNLRQFGARWPALTAAGKLVR